MELIKKYFPELSKRQNNQLLKLEKTYSEWNEKINVISRKDMDAFYERHVLHSLALSKCFDLSKKKQVLDIGTGGGLPGIPMAIMYPETKFDLVDSRGKKIKVVQEVIATLQLSNVKAYHSRAEEMREFYDAAISRAVAPALKLHNWTDRNLNSNGHLLMLKGGDLNIELKELKKFYRGIQIKKWNISDFFSEPFFETKKVIVTQRN